MRTTVVFLITMFMVITIIMIAESLHQFNVVVVQLMLLLLSLGDDCI